MVVRKKTKKKADESSVNEVASSPLSIIWELGRAYYAYIGLLERVLVEEKLDKILRPGMGVVLFALYEKDQVSIKDLAERSQLACSTLTGVLQRMEDAGLVARTRDEQDGRSVRVSLTPLSRKLKGKCVEVADRMTHISQEGVGPKNTSKCTQFLQGLASAYRNEEQRIATEATSQRSKSKEVPK